MIVLEPLCCEDMVLETEAGGPYSKHGFSTKKVRQFLFLRAHVSKTKEYQFLNMLGSKC
jgi:hypothetical protein